MLQIADFFYNVHVRNYPISRLHIHPYGSFVLCYDPSKWDNAYEAIIKSSLTTPKYCLNGASQQNKSTNLLDDPLLLENFIIPDIPLRLEHPTREGIHIPISKTNLTYNFELMTMEDDGFEIDCYLQFFMKCKKVVKT